MYIVHKRLKKDTSLWSVNIPAMTICECRDGVIYHNGKQLCAERSRIAHQHFAAHDDGNGMLRGQLTQAIQKELEKNMGEPINQERWDKVWDDTVCQKYKREEYDDHWLWNHAFYTAEIEDLQYIARLVGAKEVK